MSIMRLTDGSTTIDFDPGFGYTLPDDFEEAVLRTLNGKEYRYPFYHSKRWEIPLKYLVKSKADQFNTWRQNNTELTFYPDYENAPATSYSVRIQNATNPLAKMDEPTFDTYYSGTLILQEV